MKTKPELSELWSGVLRDESEAFNRIYKELYPFVYGYMLKSTKDSDAALDLTQDLFIRLWVKRHKIGQIICTRQYFLTSAKSVFLNHLRKKSIPTVSLSEDLQLPSDQSHENVLIEKETDRLHTKNFELAFLDLTARQRELLYMKFHYGCSYCEIEERTGINYQSIANHLCRATNRLRTAIGNAARPGKYFVLEQ